MSDNYYITIKQKNAINIKKNFIKLDLSIKKQQYK